MSDAIAAAKDALQQRATELKAEINRSSEELGRVATALGALESIAPMLAPMRDAEVLATPALPPKRTKRRRVSAREAVERRVVKSNGGKLTQAKADEIRRRVAKGDARKEIADRYGVSAGMVDHIVAGRCWGPKPSAGEVAQAKSFEKTLKELRPTRKAGCGHDVPVKQGVAPKECPGCRAAAVPASQPMKRERLEARAKVEAPSLVRARAEAEPGKSWHCTTCGGKLRGTELPSRFNPPRCDVCARRKGLMPPEKLSARDGADAQPGDNMAC